MMDFANTISEFFNMLVIYIKKVISYFSDSSFSQLLKYLFDCIPEDIRFILFLFFLLVVLIGFLRLFKE